MGSSQSITTQVNKAVQDTEANETCNCSAVVDNHIGDINLNYGPCCMGTNLTISQNASAKCNCSMSMAITSLAQQANTMTNEAKSSLSLTSSTQQGNMTDEQFVKTALNATCGTSASATNFIKQINETLADCCDMTSAEVNAFKNVKQNISQTGSVQAQCLMSLAAKVSSSMSNKATGKALSTDPLNAALDTGVDGLSNMMTTLAPYLPIIVIAVIAVVGIMLVLKFTGGKSEDHSHNHDDEDGDDGDEYDDERAEMSLVTTPKKLTRRIVKNLIRATVTNHTKLQKMGVKKID